MSLKEEFWPLEDGLVLNWSLVSFASPSTTVTLSGVQMPPEMPPAGERTAALRTWETRHAWAAGWESPRGSLTPAGCAQGRPPRPPPRSLEAPPFGVNAAPH